MPFVQPQFSPGNKFYVLQGENFWDVAFTRPHLNTDSMTKSFFSPHNGITATAGYKLIVIIIIIIIMATSCGFHDRYIR
jgi:hypothetical protein